MSLQEFLKKVGEAIFRTRAWPRRELTLVYNNDADGICAAAIVKKSLEREGFRIKSLCLEKLYPRVCRNLHARERGILFYADLGSSHTDLVSDANGGRNLVVILDHHDPALVWDPMVFDLNLEHFGYRGEADFSSSTCSYLFAKELCERNFQLAYLALTGSLEIPGEFSGLNAQVLSEALERKVVRRKGKSYESARLGMRIDELFSVLQILGSVGYYRGGPELGLSTCLEGFTRDVERVVERLEAERKEANRRLLERLLEGGLGETEHVQYFDSGDSFRGMGVKVLGTFCSYLSYQRRIVKQDKYLIGFMRIPREVPGWGDLGEELVKVSARTAGRLRNRIERGEMPPVVEVLKKAVEGTGGFADGHAFAASCVIPVEFAGEFAEEAERAVRGK